MKKWICSIALALTAVASVAAYEFGLAHNFSLERDGGTGYEVLYAYAGIVSRVYPTGPTFIQVRIDGYNGACVQGFPWYGWCADNAHGDFWNGFSSAAKMRGPVVPYGCYTSTHAAWIDGTLVSNYPIGGCWYPPPPPPSGEDCDPALDGSYQEGACVSPIVIDPSGRYAFRKVKHGALFDIDADGTAEVVSWPKRGSDVEFLAYDRNGNGQIDSGAELFGDHTRPGSFNGFDALLQEAGGNLAKLDASHPLFARLLLWNDRNTNGISEPEELRPASAALSAIGLGYYASTDRDKVGNAFKFVGWARNLAGEDFKIFDVFLSTIE